MGHSSTGRGQIVVVVEDEALVRDLAMCELEDSGYRVVGFASADDALPYLRLHGGEAAVLVTDVQMPGALNGLELVEIIARIWPGTPVLVTSGGPLVDPSRLPQCARFIAKPWHPADMVDRVRNLATRSAAAH